MAVADELTVPLLVLHGDPDLINPFSGSRAVVDKVRGDATLNIHPDVFHGLEDEPEALQIIDDAVIWIHELLVQVAHRRSGRSKRLGRQIRRSPLQR